MKKILLLLIIFIATKIFCRFLYFSEIKAIAPSEEIYYLSKSEVFNKNNVFYKWTKYSFLKEEVFSTFRRLPIGGINYEYRGSQGEWHLRPSETFNKINSIYWFLLILECYIVFFLDLSVFIKKKGKSNT